MGWVREQRNKEQRNKEYERKRITLSVVGRLTNNKCNTARPKIINSR